MRYSGDQGREDICLEVEVGVIEATIWLITSCIVILIDSSNRVNKSRRDIGHIVKRFPQSRGVKLLVPCLT